MYYIVFSEKRYTYQGNVDASRHSINEQGKFDRKFIRKLLKGHRYEIYGHSKTIFHIAMKNVSEYFKGHVIEVSSKDAAFRLKLFNEKIGDNLVYQGVYGDICPYKMRELYDAHNRAKAENNKIVNDKRIVDSLQIRFDHLKQDFNRCFGENEGFNEFYNKVYEYMGEQRSHFDEKAYETYERSIEAYYDMINYVINSKLD